jgi:pimeloyl-ACP methyl ester carboxylesterase
VLLLHGIFRSKDSFGPMVRALRADGYEAHAINYPSTRQGLQDHADQVQTLLEHVRDADRVSFVTHSMGGMVARLVLSRLDRPWRARVVPHRLVTIGTPTADQVHTLILKETASGTVRAFTFHADATPTAAEVATGLAAAVNAGAATHKFAVSLSADVADTLLITNADGLAFTVGTTRGSASVVSGTSAHTYLLSGTVTAGEVYSVTLVPASGSARVFAFEAATADIDDVLAGLAAAVNTAR